MPAATYVNCGSPQKWAATVTISPISTKRIRAITLVYQVPGYLWPGDSGGPPEPAGGHIASSGGASYAGAVLNDTRPRAAGLERGRHPTDAELARRAGWGSSARSARR